jgi:hypothetical protein
MRRIVPSQARTFIDEINRCNDAGDIRINSVGSAKLTAALELVDQIPEELLTLDAGSYSVLILAKAQIKEIVVTWKANRMAARSLQDYMFNASNNPLTLMRDVLAKCPDESPAPSASELDFISNPDLRMNLRVDISAINRALSNGEWKAATVLAGSVIEALLLWALQQRSDLAQASQITPKLPNKPLDEWHLPEYIEAADRLKILRESTVAQAKLAQNFRNLIHPGRAQRLGQNCDRGTALSAVASVEHVVRDLSGN